MTEPEDEGVDQELTPKQSEQIRKAVEGIQSTISVPDMSKLFPGLAAIQRDLNPGVASIQSAFESSHKPFLDMSRSLGVNLPQFKLDLPLSVNLPQFKIDLPPLTLDYERLFGPAINMESLGLRRAIDASSAKLFDGIYESQRKRFEELFASIRRGIEKLLPPNWRGLTDFSNSETLLLDEGLALAWVPPREILQLLFDAPTQQDRRKILGRRWKRVVLACRESLESISGPDLAEYRRFALSVVAMLESGHPEGAQALAANLLDTMLRETLDRPDHRLVTDQRTRLLIDDLPMRAAVVFGGIWGSHTEFWALRGDAIPRGYTRHASAHGVSRRQYSRINAVIALMHVTAYLKLLESDGKFED